VTALAYEPFVANLGTSGTSGTYSEWFIERVASDSSVASHIQRWRAMSEDGWNVAALVAPDSKTVVALGCK
jgi:hypothetical protein